MTAPTADAPAAFAHARRMHDAALRQLAAGDIRNGADLAWRAARRATDALIIARSGIEPGSRSETGRALRNLAHLDPAARVLTPRYYERLGILDDECAHLGLCEPLEDIEELIRETAGYIDDARRLAGV